MRHQEGTGEAKRCAYQSADPIQFRSPEFDFESKPHQLQIDV
jgi:hypothetical protein